MDIGERREGGEEGGGGWGEVGVRVFDLVSDIRRSSFCFVNAVQFPE